MARSNISFLGNVSREEVIQNFSEACALIFPGVEDFGITPLESLASATPVIAFEKGGVLETLNSDVAVFFKEPTVESLKEAIKEFEQKSFDPKVLMDRAHEFSKESFQKKILNAVDQIMGH